MRRNNAGKKKSMWTVFVSTGDGRLEAKNMTATTRQT